VEYRALHPDEVPLHHELRDALNANLTSKDFFAWINVEPSGEMRQFADLAGLVGRVEQWLGQFDPDGVQEKDLPKLHLVDPAAEVEVTALPKKVEARGRRADQIVGNPSPPLVGWS
jgi:hypothetical protein